MTQHGDGPLILPGMDSCHSKETCKRDHNTSWLPRLVSDVCRAFSHSWLSEQHPRWTAIPASATHTAVTHGSLHARSRPRQLPLLPHPLLFPQEQGAAFTVSLPSASRIPSAREANHFIWHLTFLALVTPAQLGREKRDDMPFVQTLETVFLDLLMAKR